MIFVVWGELAKTTQISICVVLFIGIVLWRWILGLDSGIGFWDLIMGWVLGWALNLDYGLDSGVDYLLDSGVGNDETSYLERDPTQSQCAPQI